MKCKLALLLLCLSACLYAGNPLVILHTNDTHSQLEPYGLSDLKLAGKGGIVRREAIIRQIRKQEPNVLVVESGDFVQGSPYFNVYHGEAEIALMNKLRLDAQTLGNHEFDNGLDFLARMLRKANFKVVCTNYDFSATVLKKRIKPWIVVRKGKLRIGIVSANIAPFGLIAVDNFEGMKYLNPLKTVDSTATWLKEQKKCDLVVCLSHLGYDREGSAVDDLVLVSKSHSIDVVLGGHTHTSMKEPVVKMNADDKAVVINQCGKGGVLLGKLVLDVTRTEAKKR
jgi:5'-nucleotidase